MSEHQLLTAAKALHEIKKTLHARGEEIRTMFPETAGKTDAQILGFEIQALISLFQFQADDYLAWANLSVEMRKTLQDLANPNTKQGYNPDVRNLLDETEINILLQRLSELR